MIHAARRGAKLTLWRRRLRMAVVGICRRGSSEVDKLLKTLQVR